MGAETRHQCLIYGGAPSAQLPGLASVTREKLKANKRCLFLNSPAMVAGFRSYLWAAGVDVEREVRLGSLVLSSDQGHLVGGRFDAAGMLLMLRDTLTEALSDGYAALWATGDMMWELGSEKNLEKLLEYEIGLEELFEQCPALSGICQYHQSILPKHSTQVALYTHQAVYLNETLSRLNPFYTQPETLRHERSGEHLLSMLEQLQTK